MQAAIIFPIKQTTFSSIQRRWVAWLCIIMLGGLNPLSCLWHCASPVLSENEANRNSSIFVCLIAQSQPPTSALHTHSPTPSTTSTLQALFKLIGMHDLVLGMSWQWQKQPNPTIIWHSQTPAPPLAPPPE